MIQNNSYQSPKEISTAFPAAQDKTNADIPLVMSVDQMAKILLIGRNAAYALVRQGKIKSIRNGRLIRITRKCLLAYLESAPS